MLLLSRSLGTYLVVFRGLIDRIRIVSMCESAFSSTWAYSLACYWCMPGEDASLCCATRALIGCWLLLSACCIIIKPPNTSCAGFMPSSSPALTVSGKDCELQGVFCAVCTAGPGASPRQVMPASRACRLAPSRLVPKLNVHARLPGPNNSSWTPYSVLQLRVFRFLRARLCSGPAYLGNISAILCFQFRHRNSLSLLLPAG